MINKYVQHAYDNFNDIDDRDQFLKDVNDFELLNIDLLKSPMVVVIVLAYNHSKYLKECLDSIVNQVTNFNTTCLIVNDCSDDNTHKISREFLQLYPSKVAYLKRNVNLGRYTKSGRYNLFHALAIIEARYVSIVDGDDYWSDINKLQKQFDYLEKNKSVSLCSHRYRVFDGFSMRSDDLEIEFDSLDPITVQFSDNDKYHMFRTCCAIFRLECLDIYKLSEGTIDLSIWANLLYKGDGVILSDCMAVYRVHDKGISTSSTRVKQHIRYFAHLALLNRHWGSVPWVRDLYDTNASNYIYYLRDGIFDASHDMKACIKELQSVRHNVYTGDWCFSIYKNILFHLYEMLSGKLVNIRELLMAIFRPPHLINIKILLTHVMLIPFIFFTKIFLKTELHNYRINR